MKILCRRKITLFENDEGFTVSTFQTETDKITFPDGKCSKNFIAKGYLLPDENVLVELSGEFEKYKNKFTLVVSQVEEIIPTEKNEIISYLTTLSGVGPALAKRMYDKFNVSVFDILENEPEKLKTVSGISTKTVTKILTSYAKKKYARELFQFLLPYNIPEVKIYHIANKLSNSLGDIKGNPYCLTDLGISFQTAEKIAKEIKYPVNSINRIYAAIMEVTLQSEHGGNLFNNNYPYPSFMYQDFLDEHHFRLLNEKHINVAGSTYIPADILYVKLLALLNIPLSIKDYYKCLKHLNNQKALYVRKVSNTLVVYRYETAKAEFQAANKIHSMVNSSDTNKLKVLPKVITNVQRELTLKLTDEQCSAVKTALSNNMSILTGGPGTGKTSVLKCLIETYKCIYPSEDIVLLAPTGMAAKKMEKATGYPASTIHSKLKLYSTEGILKSNSDEMIIAGLVIVDEASMLGSIVFSHLLENIMPNTKLLLVGDTDQLSSIETGCVLGELIKSEIVPVSTLTKTFRQAFGSSIITNAARIKVKETKLEYDDNFTLLECKTSKDISEVLAEVYVNEVKASGIENVIVLSPFRKSTVTGTVQLNQSLKAALNNCSSEAPFFEKRNFKYHEGDRVMWTVNTDTLTNGDIGTIMSIEKRKKELSVTVDFDGHIAKLDSEDIEHIEPAFAITVHKSQGSQFNTCILVADSCHLQLLTKSLVFTAITRASEKVIIIGQENAFKKAIIKEETSYRRSFLAKLLREKQKKSEKVSDCETQLKLTL